MSVAELFDPYRLLETLHRHRVRFVVIGAFAAVAQGYPLTTRDLDVTADREFDNLERLVPALVELEAKLRLPDGGGEFPIESRLLAEADSWTLSTAAGPLDILFAPAGTGGYRDLIRNARTITLRGTPVALASIADIIRSKEAAGREKDLIELPALRRTLERIRAREARERER